MSVLWKKIILRGKRVFELWEGELILDVCHSAEESRYVFYLVY